MSFPFFGIRAFSCSRSGIVETSPAPTRTDSKRCVGGGGGGSNGVVVVLSGGGGSGNGGGGTAHDWFYAVYVCL